METQIKKSPTAVEVIRNFKAKGINLSEEEGQQYLYMLYFFSKQIISIHNATKPVIQSRLPASNLKK